MDYNPSIFLYQNNPLQLIIIVYNTKKWILSIIFLVIKNHYNRL